MERFTKFFTSLGGVLTSLAAVIGGAAALYVAFGGGSDKSRCRIRTRHLWSAHHV